MDGWHDCTHIFSNGTEFEFFVEDQCEKCKRYRNSRCSILNKCYIAMFDESKFPYDDLLDHEKYANKRCKHKTTETIKKHKKPISGQMSII